MGIKIELFGAVTVLQRCADRWWVVESQVMEGGGRRGSALETFLFYSKNSPANLTVGQNNKTVANNFLKTFSNVI